MDKKLNILWLPGWFPSKVDFLPGDFIERHARSASLLMNIVVLFVIKDTRPQLAENKIEIEYADNLIIYRGYYTCSTKFGWLSNMISVFRYYKLLFIVYKKAKKYTGSFDLAHVHIALKQGLFAIWLKWKYQLKYVVTEQSAYYMPGNQQFFF